MKTVFFRTDFNKEIGLGHYIRCISLADIIEKKYRITFVSNSKISSKDFVRFYKYNILFVENEIEFFNILEPENIVVVDSYAFNESIQSEINKTGVKLIIIDDLNSMKYNCNAIINHGVFYKKEDYNCNINAKLYLGLDYLLVRNEFINISKDSPRLITYEKFKSVFICFGGTNQIELINKTIEILFENGITIFNVLIHECLVDKVCTIQDIEIYSFSNLNPSEIIDLIKRSDFAILPASTILLETFTVGIPIISGWFVENQKYSLCELEKMGLIINIDEFNSDDYKSKLNNALLLLLKNNKEIVKNQKKRIHLNENSYLKIFDEIN